MVKRYAAAMKELLQLSGLKGCIVTLDAIGCQQDIANGIVYREAEYVLTVKAHQQTLLEEIQWFFDDIEIEKDKAEGLIDCHKTVDKDHGRLEIREYLISSEVDWLKSWIKDWKESRPSGQDCGRLTEVVYTYYIIRIMIELTGARTRDFHGAGAAL